jgi:enoyl-CoA hydratase/carnithine racemase
MDFKNIKIRSEQNIGFVQIDRVADKNSLNIETSKEILQALTNLIRTIQLNVLQSKGMKNYFHQVLILKNFKI